MTTCKCRCGTDVGYGKTWAPGHNPGTRARWAGHDPTVPSENCAECDVPMVAASQWRKMSTEERSAADFVRRWGKGLCDRCGKAERRAADPTRANGRSPYRFRDDMLDEWELLRSDGVTDLTQAAVRMGVTKDALQKCLERARKAGDPRGVVHKNSDLSGGHHVGTTTRRAA
jgi:hypothetical protein